MPDYKDEILHHEYDGIREYDNPMPKWWSSLFLGCVIWAFFYVVAIGLGYIWDYQTDLKEGQGELVAMREAHKKAQPPLVINEALLASAVLDGAKVSSGQKVFASSCAACHGNVGQGMIGPNLTDNHWLYGGQLTEIHQVIHQGTPKGMPPWGSVLTQQQVVDVVAYIRTINGTNPPGAKEPQGKLVEIKKSPDKAPADAPNKDEKKPAQDEHGSLDLKAIQK